MAAVIDINIVCNEFCDFMWLYKEYVSRCAITSGHVVRDWRAISHAELSVKDLMSTNAIPFQQILESVEAVVIEGATAHFRRQGCIISRQGNAYLCNIWLDTIDDPTLDSMDITDENVPFYDALLTEFDNLLVKRPTGYPYAAVGVEADFVYCPSVWDSIAQSKYISAWIINKSFSPNPCVRLDHYIVQHLERCLVLIRSADG